MRFLLKATSAGRPSARAIWGEERQNRPKAGASKNTMNAKIEIQNENSGLLSHPEKAGVNAAVFTKS